MLFLEFELKPYSIIISILESDKYCLHFLINGVYRDIRTKFIENDANV